MTTSEHCLTSASRRLEPKSRSREPSFSTLISNKKRIFEEDSGGIDSSHVLTAMQMWLDYGAVQRQSPHTIAARQITVKRLDTFLQAHNIAFCGRAELLRFFGQLVNQSTGEPLKPRTAETIYDTLRTFFRWMVSEGLIEVSPIERVPRPISRRDQVQPMTKENLVDLLAAARNSYYPRHNEALIRFLVDTGVRASEFCSIRLKDVDMRQRSVLVTGKGNKQRTVAFAEVVSRSLWAYLRGRGCDVGEDGNEPLFVAHGGFSAGSAMTRSGVFQAVQRLGQQAGIHGVRCSPHTLRHTFAVNFVRNGGSPFALMGILGHTDLQMTNRYVMLAQADIAAQHAKFSPMDNMGI